MDFDLLIHDDFWVMILPLVIANIIHMILVKLNWFSTLSIPIHLSYFGKNKTLRGFMVLTLLNGFLILPFYHVKFIQAFFTGAALGFSYMLFELPNSYFKRRVGIKAGDRSYKNSWLNLMIDKSDSCLGVCICYYFLRSIPIERALFLFLISVALHFIISWILFVTKIKKGI